ncbi:hypothetical protein EMIT0P228_10738 [Pseudomonas brassicacearum]
MLTVRYWPFSASRFFDGHWSIPDANGGPHQCNWLVDGNEYGWSRGMQFRKQDFGGSHSLEPDVSITEIHTHRQAWISG